MIHIEFGSVRGGATVLQVASIAKIQHATPRRGLTGACLGAYCDLRPCTSL